MSSESNADGEEFTQKTMPRRRFLAGAGATAAAVAGGTGAAAAASTSWKTTKSDVNWDSEFVQSPYFAEGTLTRAKHLAKWGLTRDDLTYYKNNNGNKEKLPGYVPTENTENVVTLRADKVDAPALSIFPRDVYFDEDGDGSADTKVSALDATHYTTTNATNGTITVENVDRDASPALRISTASLASGETVKATFTDVDIQSDAAKRIFAGVANINQLDSPVTVDLVAIDDDGDEKVISAVAGGDTSKTGVFASGTGMGKVFGQRNADLATGGSGDGSFDSIVKFQVRVSASGSAGNADVTLTGLDIERKSLWSWGSYLKNEGTTDEKRVERVRPHGKFTVTSLETVGNAFTSDDVVFHDVEQPMRYTLEASDLEFEYRFVEASQRQGYDHKFQMRGKQIVPQGIDLTHTGLEWLDLVDVPETRFAEVWTKSGVGTTDLADIDDDTKTTHSGAYDAEGKKVQLKASGSAGTKYAYGATILVVGDDEKDKILAGSDSSSGGKPPASGGGMSNTVLGILGGGISGLLALVAGIKGDYI